MLRITFRIQQTAQSGSQIYAEQQVIVTYIYIDDPLLGDLNNDGGWNALDLVLLVNCILSANCSDLYPYGNADLNGDGGYSVLDVVTIGNCILSANCSDL